MNYFVDIKVLPDTEFVEHVLLDSLFAKLHRALARFEQNPVGISFPAHRNKLGDTLRLHGAKDVLTTIMATNWLGAMTGYCIVGTPTPIPDTVQYRCVRRVQRNSVHNKRARAVRKGWLTEAEAIERYPDQETKTLKLPYVHLRSLSTGQSMPVFIEHGPCANKPTEGFFSSYGLSASSTIPWF